MSIDVTWPTLHRVSQQLLQDLAQQETYIDFACQWFVPSESGDDSLSPTSLQTVNLGSMTQGE
jgi:hypothetical protein